MIPSTRRFFGLVATLLMLLALPACATPPGIVHHGFSFGGFGGKENHDIYILNYRYGEDKTAPTRPADWQLAEGKIPQRMSMGTFAPPGDSLYVKWRVISTGKIYEDTVNLKNRLPWDMDGKEIHFMIEGPQLYVYLIEGDSSAALHAKNTPDCPPEVDAPFKCARIYPDHWKNF